MDVLLMVLVPSMIVLALAVDVAAAMGGCVGFDCI